MGTEQRYYGIPLHNFIGWFVVSVVIFALVRVRPQMSLWAKGVGPSIVLFLGGRVFVSFVLGSSRRRRIGDVGTLA
ncbi:MAG: carotenoid biosynthesis protein [Acidobacteriota bacterium]